MTPLVMDRIGDDRHRRVQALGVRAEPAHHVRQLVRCASASDARVTDATSSPSSAASARAGRSATSRSTTTTIAPLLDAATFAPSAENRQPWEFVVVRDAATRAAIGDLTRRAWEAHGRAFSETRLTPQAARRGRPGRDRRHRGRAGEHRRVRRPRARPRGDDRVVDLPRGAEPAARGDRARARQRARRRSPPAFRAELQALLGLPDHVVPVAVVPLGWPARPLGPPRREPFAEHTHRERYGNAW